MNLNEHYKHYADETDELKGEIISLFFFLLIYRLQSMYVHQQGDRNAIQRNGNALTAYVRTYINTSFIIIRLCLL